jgi:hypothetical protein
MNAAVKPKVEKLLAVPGPASILEAGSRTTV